MLRETLVKCNYFKQLIMLPRAYLFTGLSCFAKTNITRTQIKAFGKLFGARVAGSKKRWYPTEENNISHSSFFLNPTSGAARKSYGKNTVRRMAVLNKLLMGHITDLLATGEISQYVLGRGLQISGVKISPDFAFVSVLWAGNGISSNDLELEKELQRCSGTLRHKLSQLCLMGEIPRISFVYDNSMAGLANVEELLCTVGSKNCKEEKLKREFLRGELLSESTLQATAKDVQSGEIISPPLPEMRHNVLGLDHRNIMTKILTKMRKSKQAWESHLKDINAP